MCQIHKQTIFASKDGHPITKTWTHYEIANFKEGWEALGIFKGNSISSTWFDSFGVEAVELLIRQKVAVIEIDLDSAKTKHGVKDFPAKEYFRPEANEVIFKVKQVIF